MSDAALRSVERTAPGTEAHAAALARVGRWVEAGDAYRLLLPAADERREQTLRALRDAERTACTWAIAGPLARADQERRDGPLPTAADLRALRRLHRAACAELRRLRAALTACDLADVSGRRTKRVLYLGPPAAAASWVRSASSGVLHFVTPNHDSPEVRAAMAGIGLPSHHAACGVMFEPWGGPEDSVPAGRCQRCAARAS